MVRGSLSLLVVRNPRRAAVSLVRGLGGAELTEVWWCGVAVLLAHFLAAQRVLRYLVSGGAELAITSGGAQSSPNSGFSGAWAWWSGATRDLVVRSRRAAGATHLIAAQRVLRYRGSSLVRELGGAEQQVVWWCGAIPDWSC